MSSEQDIPPYFAFVKEVSAPKVAPVEKEDGCVGYIYKVDPKLCLEGAAGVAEMNPSDKGEFKSGHSCQIL